nr:hypothetical protein OG999_12725 [Streptomyces sp. NBC_00886]
MTTPDVFALLLAVSVALHVGNAAAFLAWRAGTSPPASVLVGGSAAASTWALYLSGISAYR